MRMQVLLSLFLMVSVAMVSTAMSQEKKEDKDTSKVTGTFVLPKELDSFDGRVVGNEPIDCFIPLLRFDKVRQFVSFNSPLVEITIVGNEAIRIKERRNATENGRNN